MYIIINRTLGTPLCILVEGVSPSPIAVWETSKKAQKHLRGQKFSDDNYVVAELTNSLVDELAVTLKCTVDQINFLKIADESWISRLSRWYGGVILAFFGLFPAWIFFEVVMSVIHDPKTLDWGALAVVGGCAALCYFFGLLSYRAFTGRGRKKDGGLLPPWAMKSFIHLFGVIAACLVIVGIYNSEIQPILGGTLYLIWAYSALIPYYKKSNKQ